MSPYLTNTRLLTSPEYDSFLTSSTLESFIINFFRELNTDSIQISFRASDTRNDPLADLQWTDFVDLDDSHNGTTVQCSDLGFPEVKGRYKQAQIKLIY